MYIHVMYDLLITCDNMYMYIDIHVMYDLLILS